MVLISDMLLKINYYAPRAVRSSKINKKFIQGFTLIELTVVLLLIGLIFFTTMPKLDNFLFRSNLKSVARSLKAAVHILRSKSIVSHKNTALNFDLDKGLFWGDYEQPDAEFQTSEKKSHIFSPQRLPRGIRFLDAMNINSDRQNYGLLRSILNPKGVIEETVLHLTDENDRILTIIINAYTGRFLLYDEYVDVEYGEK